MLNTQSLSSAFASGVGYAAYLAAAKPNERANWEAFAKRVSLSPSQRELISTFARRINVLCISGSWCGDCVQQVPILAAIATCLPARPQSPSDHASPGIDFRLLERDAHPDFARAVSICGGLRVPVVVFMNEDCEFVSLMGDRPISRYRAIAARNLGPSCPLPGAPIPADEVAATVADWLTEFERVSLLLRLSPKLRARHED